MGKRKRRLPPNVKVALAELKVALANPYGDRLRGVYLFGSYARGDYREESDVDVLIVLAGPVQAGKEISRYNRVVADISLQNDLLISTVPVAEESFWKRAEPLYENVLREGVAL